jgi:hypothetical protein
MSDEYENGLFDKISVWMSSREMGAEVLLSLGRVDNGGRFDPVFEMPYKILLMKKVIIKMLTEDFIMSKFVPSTDTSRKCSSEVY